MSMAIQNLHCSISIRVGLRVPDSHIISLPDVTSVGNAAETKTRVVTKNPYIIEQGDTLRNRVFSALVLHGHLNMDERSPQGKVHGKRFLVFSQSSS